MPRVHVKKARKDYPNAGIKKGDTYYSWSFRYGGKRMSKTKPRPSQLTLSKMSEAYAASEALEDTIASASTPEELKEALEQAAEEITAVADEYQSSMENMIAQAGQIYEDMEQKVSDLQDWASALESDVGEIESMDDYESFEKLNADAQSELMDQAKELASQNSSPQF